MSSCTQPYPAQNLSAFVTTIIQWQKQHGRHHLPWQQTRDAYRIWLSEIMLQQTQVSTVIDYYQRFLERFPTLQDLAQADQAQVMPYWAGLGYYARARNLHKCAQALQADHGGSFPEDPEVIATLPGIGRSTAGAIAAFAYGVRTPIMDGNVKRVFTRYFGIAGYPGNAKIEKTLWALAHNALDAAPATLDIAAYTQGLMDLGSGPCARRNPSCEQCPLTQSCHARVHGLQNQLPTPKPRAEVPVRSCHMLILLSNDTVLLEQRPDSGIWGGLWSLPEFDSPTALASYCVQRGVAAAPQRMGGLQHVFTHFKLDITPWQVNTTSTTANEPEPQRQWFDLQHWPALALPAPVKKILAGLAQPSLISAPVAPDVG
ncbi:A/G-specific adenine glycosylase [Pusillimonas sp. T2]|uniref:A/G-specific adenine glycosylase n=1 Tax=Pusillimonas sp. T2 TaxID=1548123 RepID=UPI000B9CF82A|nr:A/G-specific adenine glycosylase [Pusillimonas sp. T2]OXR49971.1 A/G-specific adenine glycosylase [Pusillimonas sp. T2]